MSSDRQQCLDQLHQFRASGPTALLLELSATASSDDQSDPRHFLQTLATQIDSSEKKHPVLSFALLATDASDETDRFMNDNFESTLNGAGPLDTIRSPLCSEALDCLIGHIKDAIRPSARTLGSGMAYNLVRHITNSTKPRTASYRPDEMLSAQRKAAVEDAIVGWQFPAHEFDMDELTYGALIMLERVLQNPELESYRLTRPELMTFILAARREYKHEREVHYHNWRHAVDVTQSLYCFLCNVRLCPPTPKSLARRKNAGPNAVECLLSPVEALILLVSAVGHDVGHPGVNNAFLVASNHQLAHVYNDKSVLENYHCAAYSQLLRRHWPALSNIAHFRSSMISIILATDMQRHFEYMGYLKDLKQKVEQSDSQLSDWNEKDRTHARELVMALLLKAADISNVARPFEISSQWAKILMNEFARQGELESELQIPTCLFGGPPDQGDLLAAAQSQKGFMNLFGVPLFQGISELIPNVSCTIAELNNNREVWERKIADETARREVEDPGRSSSRTYGSVTDSQVEEARMRKRESEPAAVPIQVPQTPTSAVRRQPGIESGAQGATTKHPASDQRHHLSTGVPMIEEKRASTPVLWPSAIQLSPTGGSSRRSSKDVALNHMQEISAYAQHNLAPVGSRRGSGDAGWQLHQNYPGSRRGSKEESLTTILVTSQGSPANRSPSSSQTRIGKPISPARNSGISTRHGLKQGPGQNTAPSGGAARGSALSSRSQTTISATAMTDQQSSSTQPSSLATTEDETNPPGHPHGFDGAVPSLRTDSPSDSTEAPVFDGVHSSAPAILTKSESSRDSGMSQLDMRKRSEPHIRESRSRSRLRGLKFWKRKDRGVDSPPPGERSP